MSARSPVHLPDVNVLLSLLWPRHINHQAAQRWFVAEGQFGWATNTPTQIGVIRLLTNPLITNPLITQAVDHPSR